MIFGDTPSFDEILKTLRDASEAINPLSV
jgi:hypothetical protein